MKYLSPLEMLDKWEKEKPNQIFLSQPINNMASLDMERI